jgi:hypothetical protein
LCSGGKQEEAQDELLYSSLGLASLAAITAFDVLSRKHRSKLMRALPDDFEQRSNSTLLIASRSLVEENQHVEEGRATTYAVLVLHFWVGEDSWYKSSTWMIPDFVADAKKDAGRNTAHLSFPYDIL